MSKTISYRGTLAVGLEDKINLRTIKGKVGYRITKFQIMSTIPGQANAEYVCKITKVPDPNIGPVVNFTDPDMMACVYSAFSTATNSDVTQVIIFDNELTNQNVFVSLSDAAAGTTPCNYYIEFETVSLDEVETTMLTLKNLRTVTSR